MGLELIEDAKGDPRNANTLALASDLAYLAEAEGAAAFRDQLGLEARLFSVGNTQGYLAQNNDHIVVAFRGTESPATVEGLKDWLLTDAANLLITPEGPLGTDLAAAGVGARWHQGFVNAIYAIWPGLSEAVQVEMKKNERPLWLTGHSLGGALAVVGAWLFRRKFVQVHQVYTFGGPMVGNADVAKALDRELPDRIFRYINGLDPVPTLPTVSLIANHYLHCVKEVVLGTAAAEGDAMQAAVDFFKQMSSKVSEGKLNASAIDDIWTNIEGRVGAHSMTNYRSLIASLTK